MHYTFRGNNWETIESFWFTPWLAGERRLCIIPAHPLRLKVGFFTIKAASDGCINYGGGSSVLYQRVQACANKGESIEIIQTVPAPA
jgi:hypothetical protein